jgi:hypothetical protein
MSRIIPLTVLLLSCFTTFSQRKLKVDEVEEIGFVAKTEFKPVTKTSFSYKGLDVSITPISPQELDTQFERAEGFDGRSSYTYYEKSRELFFLKNKKKFRFKSDAEFLVEGLEWLIDKEMITDEIYNGLYTEIFTYDSSSRNQTVSNFNPYSLSGKYLSVFRIDYANNTNEPVEINMNIQVVTGNEALNCLEPQDILNLYVADEAPYKDRLENLMRFDNHYLRSIPANSKISTYFSTLPIDNTSDAVEIIIPNIATLKWSLQNNRNDINKKYLFYELNLLIQDGQTPLTSGVHYTLKTENNDEVYVDYDKLYISSNFLAQGKHVKLFVYTLDNDKLYYSKNVEINPWDYIDLDKKHRKRVKIDMTEIKDLRKKVKT